MVNGVRAKKSKFPAILFQPLTLLEADYYYRENRDLQRLKEASCLYPYVTIPFNITKNTIALFLSEVLYLTLREEECNPALFAFLFRSFQLMDTEDACSANFHLWFMLHFSRFLGILPVESNTFMKKISSSEMQTFRGMPADAVSALILLLANPDGLPHDIGLSNQNRSLLLERIVRYYSQHMEGFSNLKSLQVLREVFG
jgi:DNA repair protein RecO (recombination protein O)